MSASPLVIAVPVFNGQRFLGETLASLNANGAALRWWLQDGGSADVTLQIARSFAREGDTIVSEPDRGQADALNRAMRTMGGEIIGFLNADDLLLPDAAAKVLAFFAERPEIDLVYGSVEWIDEHGRVTGEHTGQIDSLAEVLDIYGVWWRQRQWVQPEVFFRRTLWEKVGGFDTSYHLAFDYDFWVRSFQAGARVAHLPATLSRFRLHPAQKSTAAKRAADEIRAIVGKHLPRSSGISAPHRRALAAQLSYDLYQSAPAGRGSFLRELLRYPLWLLAPPARARVRSACAKLFRGPKQSA